MTRLRYWFLLMFASFLFPLLALADLAEPTDPTSALSYLSPLLTAIKGGQWSIAAALILVVLVYVFRVGIMPKLGLSHPAWVPAMSALLPVVLAVAGSLYVGLGVWPAIAGGLFTGAAASGLWSWVGSLFLHVPPTAAVTKPPAA